MIDGPPYDAGAILLAGGQSRRMGQNKYLLPYRGQPLIQNLAHQLRPIFGEVLVSTNTPATYAFLDLPMVSDAQSDCGPLMGIASTLEQSNFAWNLVVAGDIPEMPLEILHALFQKTPGQRCVVPITESGRLQPLFALYHRTLAPPIHRYLEMGLFRATEFVASITPCEVLVPDAALKNLNTPEDYQAALENSPQEDP